VEDGQAVPDTLSRSDTVWTSTLQGGIDQPIGRQRVFGNASLHHTRFGHNRVYDNSGYRLSAGAEGSTVERISGSVGVTLQRNLAQFSNDEVGVLTRSNIERTQQVDSALRWGISARLAAEATLNWRRVDFSAPEFASREFRQGGAYLGLRQTFSGALNASIGLRQSRGVYPNFRRLDDTVFEADRFQRRELELKVSLNPGGSSSVDARFGLGRTRYDTATSRDLSGPFGALDWSWRPTGRLRVQAFWSRSPSQDSYFTTTLFGRGTLSYDRVATSLQLRTDYGLTAKTSLTILLTGASRLHRVAHLAGCCSRPASRWSASTTSATARPACWTGCRSWAGQVGVRARRCLRRAAMAALFERHRIDAVVHFAA
jgi:hypothetical protein